MTAFFNRRERAFFYACAYLGALFASVIVLWWSVLVGGNPLTFKSANIVDADGRNISTIHVGQSVGVRRHVCSVKQVGVEFFPTLRDEAGLLYPLPPGMIEASQNCATKTYGFIVPDIPPGNYVYQSTIKYQASLVGRDEMTATPEVPVRIIR